MKHSNKFSHRKMDLYLEERKAELNEARNLAKFRSPLAKGESRMVIFGLSTGSTGVSFHKS